ncbi:Uncharacterised protein [Legionella pneumophila]|nr:Uncharacterised protein [Legionella pneumophila]CZI65122.1 Uncharacterised protein [Legionella pneumophila]CZJ09994.1 Uncharacterised protein [Legionella pneumophila]CZJ15855.1 Uncharacterised protein [Legionella pneumophila]STX70023.1 Uncharacterised protein [Legionella pneumophila]
MFLVSIECWQMYITRGSLMNNYITKKEQEITMFSNRGSGLKPKTCNQKLTLHHAQEVAKNKNGKCLSEKYKNVDTKLKWECEFGHQWEATLYNVRKIGSWCPECAGVAKLTLDEMKQLAERKKGKCLSNAYINSDSKLTWECEFGHQWDALPNSIKNKKSWCPECAERKKLTISQMKELAISKGGKCLSASYKNNRSKLKWECEFGHQWNASPSSILNGNSWCPDCAGNVKQTIEAMRELARNRNGECLSVEYTNSHSKLTWQCHLGHQWEATPSDIKNGKWCRHCYKSKRKGENAIRCFFEKIFNKKFPSSRPLWLMYEGGRLELDGYCEELQIAFEYQGQYHFDKTAYWYPDKSISFERRQLIDEYKRKTCEENKVLLIEINELNPRSNPDKWKDTIKRILISKDIAIPSNYDAIPFGAVEYHSSGNYTQEAYEIAKLNLGMCHSENILYKEQLVEWECHLGHRWSASLSQVILRNTWCPSCARRKKLTIKQMQALAKLKGGKCLSTEYINARTELLWECSEGHRWLAIPSSIKNNDSWCLECSGSKKLTIDNMKELAKKRNGECLSDQYNGNKVNLIWKCNLGHIWQATPSSIKNRGAWCPVCGGSNKLTIEQMQELAKLKGGKCLSTVYVNARTKLLWECSAGHQWLAIPDKIKNIGRWCKECKKSKSTIIS